MRDVKETIELIDIAKEYQINYKFLQLHKEDLLKLLK